MIVLCSIFLVSDCQPVGDKPVSASFRDGIPKITVSYRVR